MDAINTFVDFFNAGGDFMFPVLITLLVGAAIAAERYIKLTRVMYHNKRIWLSIQPSLANGNFAQAQQLINTDNSEISGVLRRCLKRQGEIQQRDDIDYITSENMLEISPQLNKRTHYVALLANISTLFGLLGTIVGLINAFTAVAKADASEKADFLSASISVAMNTTAFGLISAIILLITYAILSAKTKRIIDSLEIISVKTLNIITEFAPEPSANKQHN
jgi:biopolymer transport protein ExbB